MGIYILSSDHSEDWKMGGWKGMADTLSYRIPACKEIGKLLLSFH